MSGRLLAAGIVPLSTRRAAALPEAAVRHYHRFRFPTGGLQRADAAIRATRQRMWFPANAFHNAVVVRNASFARFLPKLAAKFIRIPAMFGGLMIGGVAWIQYQAIQVSNSATEMYKNAKGVASETASGLFTGAKDIAGQIGRGWENTKDNVEMPEWMQKILRLQEDIGTGGEGGGPDPGKESPKYRKAAAAASASASAFTIVENDRDEEEIAKDDQMMILTKKMIEIRNILSKVGQSSALTLPSIVVIGSQSSGKSSVLEAIVGHEFLPKGSNMVTRRPIELTLVNTPDTKSEYGEFPDLGLKTTDFTSIQRTLTDLNLAVPDTECVSDDPIRLSIYSPNVPDLSLIDLPGYIQVVGQNQPLQLKQKITELCDKYIQPPNVILAISAADVDLANSTALRASRRVDPRGERTIGVITKMDLVDPVRGAGILSDKQYPLRLGYVGVVTRAPSVQALFKKGTGGNLTTVIAKNENSFFSAHPLEFGEGSGSNVGTLNLRKKLMHVLEQTMSASLQSTHDAIRQELEEATYEFKVQYNDRPLSAESYLAESLDAFKHSFKQFTTEFGRPQMQEILKTELDQRVLDLLALRYWNKPITDLSPPPPEADTLADLPKSDPDNLYWHRQLDASTSALTKLGVGRMATSAVAGAVQSHVERLIAQSTFANHPFAREAITNAASNILNERFYSTSDQVENCVKPYKFEIDIEDREWSNGREHVSGVLKTELQACQGALASLENVVGGKRKLKEVMTFVDKCRKGDIPIEGEGRMGAGGFSAALLEKGREAVFLRDRADIINMRLLAVKSRQCKDLKNKYYCPEVFLDAAASKLAQTAVLFLNVELLSEFYYNFPRELDMRLGRHLSDDDIERFAREDPKIKRHLEVIRRKEMLELVLEKMESLRQFEGRTEKPHRGAGENKRDRGGRWGLF
ncbi:dynamin family protein [Coniella lustricola]|uniref:dynamin GTPase n=1 Tax=Coniella lustricola TaxID=2025994 RepID=A0A2T2ZX53_9PEZI|nr:dynamin family protein [Coniella lustricola]